MDSRILQALDLLMRINHELRLPTVQWLFSDYFNILDITARDWVGILKDEGRVEITSGGWVSVVYKD